MPKGHPTVYNVGARSLQQRLLGGSKEVKKKACFNLLGGSKVRVDRMGIRTLQKRNDPVMRYSQLETVSQKQKTQKQKLQLLDFV